MGSNGASGETRAFNPRMIIVVAAFAAFLAPFAIGVAANMISLITIFSMNILVPTYMQSVLGTPSLVASLALFPAILMSCFASPVAGRIYDKHGAGVLLPVGFLLIAAFSALVAVVIPTGNVVLLAICYIPVICSSALVIGPVKSFALSKLPRELNPHGVTVDASAGMSEVARVLADRRLKKAPVMENGKMIGIINRSNVTKYSVNRYFAALES